MFEWVVDLLMCYVTESGAPLIAAAIKFKREYYALPGVIKLGQFASDKLGQYQSD